MTIDMHAHWRPQSLIDALRARDKPPFIETDENGVEMLRGTRAGDAPVETAFDDVGQRLEEMDRLGITTAVLSLFGQFQTIERLPAAEAVPLLELYNDSNSELCQAHPGRFAAYASLPLADMKAAVEEFERAMGLPGIVGAILPGNAFLDYKSAQEYAPLMEVANRHKAIAFVHWNPRPGDPWPRVPAGSDNMSRRLGTLDMQASLSANMVTFCFTDFLDDYPDALVHVHNLGGNLPYELERLDHRSMTDETEDKLPSERLDQPGLYVDCNSFGPRAIENGIAAYGPEKIFFGTDGTEFGCTWSEKAIADAQISEEARQAILHGNAARVLAHLTDLAPYQAAAE